MLLPEWTKNHLKLLGRKLHVDDSDDNDDGDDAHDDDNDDDDDDDDDDDLCWLQ